MTNVQQMRVTARAPNAGNGKTGVRALRGVIKRLLCKYRGMNLE
jgi:hypothetical protein